MSAMRRTKRSSKAKVETIEGVDRKTVEAAAIFNAQLQASKRPDGISRSFIGTDVPTDRTSFLAWIEAEIGRLQRLADGPFVRDIVAVRVRDAVRDARLFSWEIVDLHPHLAQGVLPDDAGELSIERGLSMLRRYCSMIAEASRATPYSKENSDSPKVSRRSKPRDGLLSELIEFLRCKAPGKRGLPEKVREFCRGKSLSTKKIVSLIRQVRKYEHLWKPVNKPG